MPPPRSLVPEPSFALAWRWLEGRHALPAHRDALWAQATPSLRARRFPVQGEGARAPRRGPLPLHAERVDPTWFWTDARGTALTLNVATRAALATLPAALAHAVCQAAGLPPGTPLAAAAPALGEAAARALWAHLVDMPPLQAPCPGWPDAPADPAALARSVAALPAEAIHEAVLRAGVPALGALLQHLPDRAAAGLCGRFPEPLRGALWQHRRGGDASAPPQATPRAALLRLLAALDQPDPARLLFGLGAQPWAAFLHHHAPTTRPQVAQALPEPAGRLLLAPTPDTPPPAEVLRQALRPLP